MATFIDFSMDLIYNICENIKIFPKIEVIKEWYNNSSYLRIFSTFSSVNNLTDLSPCNWCLTTDIVRIAVCVKRTYRAWVFTTFENNSRMNVFRIWTGTSHAHTLQVIIQVRVVIGWLMIDRNGKRWPRIVDRSIILKS